jgi:hypothetical protein
VLNKIAWCSMWLCVQVGAGISINVEKPKPLSVFLCAPMGIFWTHLVQNLIAYSNSGDLVESSTWNLWKFAWKLWNYETPSFTNLFGNALKNIITHYKWLTTSLFIVNICLPIFEHSTQYFYRSFTHYNFTVNCT